MKFPRKVNIFLLIMFAMSVFLFKRTFKEIIKLKTNVQRSVIIENEDEEGGSREVEENAKFTNDIQRLEAKLDEWQYIGKRRRKFKVFSAYFDDRIEALGI